MVRRTRARQHLALGLRWSARRRTDPLDAIARTPMRLTPPMRFAAGSWIALGLLAVAFVSAVG